MELGFILPGFHLAPVGRADAVLRAIRARNLPRTKSANFATWGTLAAVPACHKIEPPMQ